MTRTRLSILLAVVVLGGATALAVAAPDERSSGSSGERYADAALRDASGDRVGRVLFVQAGDRVFVHVRARALTPGFHGFHVHATGRCDPPTFMSAGPHLAESGQVHPDHVGDLPVLQVGEDGRAFSFTATDRFTVRDLFDGDGSAVIVHSNANNYANVPDRYTSSATGETGPDPETLAAGDSGARVACGVVR